MKNWEVACLRYVLAPNKVTGYSISELWFLFLLFYYFVSLLLFIYFVSLFSVYISFCSIWYHKEINKQKKYCLHWFYIILWYFDELVEKFYFYIWYVLSYCIQSTVGLVRDNQLTFAPHDSQLSCRMIASFHFYQRKIFPSMKELKLKPHSFVFISIQYFFFSFSFLT